MFCCLFFEFVATEKHSTEQRIPVIKTHYEHGECVAETVRRLRTISGREEASTTGAVQNLAAKYEARDSVVDIRRTSRPQNISMVTNNVDSSPRMSTHPVGHRRDMAGETWACQIEY